jgi:hypothetical protein
MDERVSNHVYARISEAPLEEHPFAYLYVENVFPAYYYSELISRLPENKFYQTYKPPYESRSALNIEPSALKGLDPFWFDFERWINGQEFLDALTRKFAAYLPAMARFRAEQLEGNATAGNVMITCRTNLIRDYGDFSLGPHTDSPHKFITALFYLSKDTRFAKFGTSIYRPKTIEYASWASKHHKHDDFELLKTLPNVPNAVFVFAKTDKSFHGVEPGAYANDGRNILQWAPQIGPAQNTWGELHLPRQIFAAR